MTTDEKNSDNETLPTRPREDIEADMRALEQTFTEFDEALNPLRDDIEELPERDKLIIDELSSRLAEEEISNDIFDELVPYKMLPIANRVRRAMQEFKKLNAQQQRLETEMTPYRREDYQNMIQNLSERLNYDAVFEYFDEKNRDPDGHVELLDTTAREIYELRRYQHDIATTSDSQRNFHNYDFHCRTLAAYAKRWKEKGFLDDEPIRNFESGQELVQMEDYRMEVVTYVNNVMEQLESYNRLRAVYQHTLSSWYPFDLALARVQNVLSIERNREEADDEEYEFFENFREIGFDPEFIAAAAKYINKAVEKHRRLGHLPPTEETLRQDRQRIDLLETDVSVNEVRFDGFTPPEGLVAVITPEDILQEVRTLLPPDFIQGLRNLSHKPRPEKSPKDDPTVETMGRYVPVFEDKTLVSADIEIYRELFAPENADELQRELIRSDFMDTVWHEFGHNAHHMMRYDEMRAWEVVMEEDNTAITWYVNYARKDSESRGKIEDFSDTFRLFVTNPATLHALSPLRYQFMFDYFQRRLKTTQQEAFNNQMSIKMLATYTVWQKNGYTAKDIKKIYLSHETDKE